MSYEYFDLFYSALFSICVYSSFSDFLLLVKFTIVNTLPRHWIVFEEMLFDSSVMSFPTGMN